MNHQSGKFIKAIRIALKAGSLKQTFRAEDVKKAVPGFANKTYNAFLPKHRRGNPGQNTELFERISLGLYRLIR